MRVFVTRRFVTAVVGGIALSTFACAATSSQTPPPGMAAPAGYAAASASASATPANEASVRPGANTEYLKPDLQVAPWVERFEKEGREIYDRRAEIVAAARLAPGAAVADVGSGTGLFTMLFADAVGPSGQVVAVDIVPRFLAHIEKRAADTGKKNIRTVLGTERSIEMGEASVDLVFLCDVYHHFEYPRSSLSSIWKALRPGGVLFIVDFKREQGKSAAWVLTHVRAGKDVVVSEVKAAGFELSDEPLVLKENYAVRFRKPR